MMAVMSATTRKSLYTVLIVLIAAIAATRVADDVSDTYAEDALKRALATFAVARTLNGVISVAQGTEIALEPGGVGVMLTPGQILDPINDLVERFLLHYFALSAHGYTRGTLTAPEASDLSDRDAPSAPYTAAGEVGATVYLKWMLCFEEPETRTLWLGKATPREWLAAGGEPLLASGLTTRP